MLFTKRTTDVIAQSDALEQDLVTPPACLLRSCEKREAEEGEEPFPRGKKRAAPLTVRKLSLMLDR